jgi:hypothetical protein
VAQAAQVIGERLAKHFGQKDAEDVERIIEDLKDVFSCAYEYDGFKLARELADQHYYELDSESVSILDDTFYAMDRAHRKEVTDWVKKHQIKPLKQVGDIVRHTDQVKKLTDAFPDGVDVEIVGINLEEYKYNIFHPDLCVRKDAGCGTLSFIVPCEEFDFVREKTKT